MGFNALTRSDYTDNDWNEIIQIRKKNNWESPQIELLNIIKQKNYFYDCLHLFQSIKKDVDNEEKCDDDLLDSNNLGTCRFDARIDYILINNRMKQLFEITDYQHIDHDNASDHKLIRVTFKLK